MYTVMKAALGQRSLLWTTKLRYVSVFWCVLWGVSLLSFAPPLEAQQADEEIRFTTFLEQEQQCSGAFAQDRRGFLWIGTFQDLLRFDGYEVTRYNLGVPVFSLLEGQDGSLWVGTGGAGLKRLDLDTNTFTSYYHDPDDPHSLSDDLVTTLAEDRDGRIWVGTGSSGLCRLDPGTGHVTRYRHDPEAPHSLSHNAFFELGTDSILEDRDGVLWFGTFGGGLNKFEAQTNTFAHYVHDPENPNSLVDDSVIALAEDAEGHLWIGTQNGLSRFDATTETFINYVHDPDDPTTLGGKEAQAILVDPDGDIWVGTTDAGVSILEPATGTFTRYPHDAEASDTVSTNYIQGIYQTLDDGIIWIINNVPGIIDVYDKTAQKFRLWQHDPNNPNSLQSNPVIPIYEDRQGMLWIGSFGGGLHRYNRRTGIFTNYPTGEMHNTPGVIFEDSAGTLWVGMWGAAALKVFDRQQEQFTARYGFNSEDPAHSIALEEPAHLRFIIEDQDDPNILWIAVQLEGLKKFYKDSGKILHYTHDPDDPTSIASGELLTLYQDAEGHIWCTSQNGLTVFNRETEIFTHIRHDPQNPHSISSNNPTEVFQDSSGTLWVATQQGGLNRYDRETGQFTHYNRETGFPSDNIHSILEDDQGHLWLGTGDIGLIKFTPEDASFKVYTPDDGLQGTLFFQSSRLKTRDGELFFGGMNGMNSFYPDKIQDNTFQPPVYITSLTQGGDAMNLDKTPHATSEITLDWHAPYFEFEFAALNYTHPEKNQYAYMLEGIDEDWFVSGTRRFGKYNSLPGGRYLLRVKGSNNDGLWSDHEAQLSVIVGTPFWRTGWFYALVGAMVIGLAAAFYVQQISRLKAQNQARLLGKEMELARQIQTAILPQEVQHDELDIEATMIPADEVGGDFYDVLPSDDGPLWLAIGDVSGHGVTPGLIMMMAQTVHTTIASHFSFSPKDVVVLTNKVLCRNVQGRLGKDHFMTFTTLKYQGNGKFEFAGAHLSLVVYRHHTQQCELIPTPGTFLNFIEDISDVTVNSSFTLNVGDILVLYSDGLTEAKNANGDILDVSRFTEIVQRHASQNTATLRDAIIQDVLQWCGNQRTDDMSLVVVRRVK